MAEATQTDWIEWVGGECPLPADTLVQVKFRDGMYSVQQLGTTAGYWDGNGSNFTSCWQHNADEGHSDIIAYRVVSA